MGADDYHCCGATEFHRFRYMVTVKHATFIDEDELVQWRTGLNYEYDYKK